MTEGRVLTFRWPAPDCDVWTPEAAASLVGQRPLHDGERGAITAARFIDQQTIEVTMTAPARVQTPEPIACEWCGRAIRPEDGVWLAVKGAERGYDPLHCDASDDDRHNPSATDGAT